MEGAVMAADKMRTVRVDDTLWAAAQTTATQHGETVSDAIRRGLTNYTDGNTTPTGDAMLPLTEISRIRQADGTTLGDLIYQLVTAGHVHINRGVMETFLR